MQRFSRYGWWTVAFVTMILLAVISRPRRDGAAPAARPIGDWDIPELVEHLNRSGVQVQLRSTVKNGADGLTAFLTATDKDWPSLNSLNKDAKRIRDWSGVLFCERVGESDVTHFTDQWGDRCLVVRPFLFYGDAGLLHRVGAALAPMATQAVL